MFESEQPYVIERVPHGSRCSDLDGGGSLGLPGRQQDWWTLPGIARAIEGAGVAALAPPRCGGCGWFSPHLFCERCAPRVRRVDRVAALCDCCGEPFDPAAAIAPGTICAACRGAGGKIASPIERARSLWMLRGPVRLAIHDFKYRRHSELAASLGAHLGAFAMRDDTLSGARLIVPVPLHPWREWARGFNQSGLLARHAAREMGLPCVEALRRVRNTRTQTSLSRAARDANVRAAFEARATTVAKYLQEDSAGLVLLVDDVWTTGATLRECARALRRAGFKSVCALTLARRGTPTNTPTNR